MKYHSISRYNHATNQNEVVSIFTDKREALDNIEDYLLQYVQAQDGAQKIPDLKALAKIICKNLSDMKEPGHYVLRCDQFNTYTIYKHLKAEENIPGKLWGTYKVEKLKLQKVYTISIIEINSDLIRQVQKAQIYNNIPSLSELKRQPDSDVKREPTPSEIKYAAVIDALDESKTMRKIRNLADAAKDYKLAELRIENKEFVKCPLANVPDIKSKETPQFSDMVKELSAAVSERNKIKEKPKVDVKNVETKKV
jgi:hypothetical protein